MARTTQAVEYDAQGKPLPASPQGVEYDAEGKPIAPSTPLAPTHNATMSASPIRGPVQYLDDAERDLRQGGKRTIIGKGLGYLQGSGDKGYSGMGGGNAADAGGPKEDPVANLMGSVPLGLTKLVKGNAEAYTGHPIKGTVDAVSGGLQAATIPAAFMGGPAAEAIDASIPSRFRAGQMLEDIRNSAQNVPVIPRATMPTLGRWTELTEAGGKTAKPITKLTNRLTDYLTPATKGPQEPMLFPEARDRYSNITDLTRQPKLQTLMGRGLKPTMLRQAGNVRTGLNSDLTDAASTIGRGEDYSGAMKEYAQAAKLGKAVKLGGVALGAEGLRRLGLLGKVAGGITQ